MVEKQYLEDLYSLTANTDSLAAMLLAHKEKNDSFEKEMKEKKELWENEKAKQKTEEKEYFDPDYGYLDFSSIGIRKVKMTASV